MLNICTHNVRTLRTENDLYRSFESLEGFHWDMIGLCETKRKGEGHWI